MTQNTGRTYNKSTVTFVNKFLTCWIANDLHKITMQAKANRFRNFTKEMQQKGEYSNGKPTYVVCKQFFLNLNPEKWSRNREKILFPLKNTIIKIFDERKSSLKEYLLESNATKHLNEEDEIQATWFEWDKLTQKNTQNSNGNEMTEANVKIQLNMLNKQTKEASNLFKKTTPKEND